MDCLKIAYVSLSKTVLLISCYSLPALSITHNTKLIDATIRHELEPNFKLSIHSLEEASVATTKRHRFSCPPHSPLFKILRSLASKSCEIDPVPSSILLDCLDLLCPVIWKIVYLSLETSVMPTELKQAVIRPMLKKPGLDHQHENFRPNPNFTVSSKVIRKVVALQLADYIDRNGLYKRVSICISL